MATLPPSVPSISTLQTRAQRVLPGVAAAAQVAQQAPVGQLPDQEALRQTVQSAITGKQATVSEGPQASQLQAERAAKAAELQQTKLQEQIKSEDVGQALQEEAAFLELDDQQFQVREQAVYLKQNVQGKLQELLQSWEQSKGELDFRREKSLAEQTTFLMRLGNEKYVNKLKIEGAKARLDSDAKFKEALMETLFQNQLELLQTDLNMKSLLRADERDFDRKLGKMNIETALKILGSELDTVQEQGLYTGLQNVVSGAAQGAYQYASSRPTTTAPTVTMTSNQYQEPAQDLTNVRPQFGEVQS